MTCKTYKEMYEEAKPYIDSEEDFKSLFDVVKNMDYAERADAYMENKLNVTDAVNAAKPWLDKQRVELVDLSKDGDKYKIAYKYLKSDKVYNKLVGEYRLSMGEEGKTFDVLVKDLDTLYSDMEFVNEGRVNYEATVVDMLKDSGKIVDLAKELVELDEVKAKNEKDLLGKVEELAAFLKEQVPEVTLQINKKAESNHGWIPMNGNKVEVFTAVGPGNKWKSALEVYAHELYHAVTRFAVDSRDPELANVMRDVKQIKNQFLEDVSVEELAKHFDGDVKEAKKILDYFADKDVGLQEFVAFAMTNHAVIETLKGMKRKVKDEEHPDFASKVASLFRKILNGLGRFVKKTKKDVNAYADMVNLVNALAGANNRQLEFKRKGVLGKAFELLDKGDEKLSEYMKKAEKKLAEKPMPKKIGKGKWSDMSFIAKMVARSFVDERAKRTSELVAGMMGLKPEGTAQTIIRDMGKSDGYQDLGERLGLMAQNIDQHREFTYTQVALALKNAFKEKLSAQESEALADLVIDADMSSVWSDFDVSKMLTDEKALDKAIRDLDKQLKDKVDVKDYRYYREQYRGLGWFMVTGQASTIQLLNARNIAEKSNHPSGKKLEIDEEVVRMIDQLASLEAIRGTSASSKKTLSELIEKDKNGVDTMVAYQLAHKTQSEEKLFNTDADRRKIIKGYSKEIYDQEIDMQTAPAADEAKMNQMGLKKALDLPKHRNDGSSVPMAMYVSNGKVVQNLHRVAMRFTDKGRRGTTIKDSYAASGGTHVKKRAERDIANINLEVAKKILAIENGDKDVLAKEDYGLVPVLDNKGDVIDYRYMMTKEKKIDLLGMDRRAVNILGRMFASNYDKEKTELFNDEVMKVIDEDAKKNYREDQNIGRNQKEYVRVNKNSMDADIRDIWSVLPDNLKRKYPDGFPIRRDMMHSLLGYRELSIVDLPVFRLMPEISKHALRIAEAVWKEVIKIFKIDIVIKTPAVMIGNIVSNFMYSVISGESPLKIAQLQLQGVRELNEYIAKTKEIIRLEAKRSTGRATEIEIRKIDSLKNDLNASSVKDLVDEGFYSSIIEELGLEEFTEEKGRLHKAIEGTKNKLPKVMKTAVDYAYIADTTPIFKALSMTIQYSDFVARYAQYHLMVRRGIDKQKAVKTVRDAYVNYNKPNSKFVEWANQMGFVMFTKYFTRIQRAIKENVETHPLRVLLAIIGQEYLFGDVEDITNQSVFTKDLGNIVYNPLDTMLGAMHPHGAEAVASVMGV